MAGPKLTRGGVYLARLDPARGAEVGKLRPVVVLTAQEILDVEPPFVFVCPLSSRSDPAYEALHVKLAPRADLRVESHALAEHCRTVSVRRLRPARLAQLDPSEIAAILRKLQRLLGA